MVVGAGAGDHDKPSVCLGGMSWPPPAVLVYCPNAFHQHQNSDHHCSACVVHGRLRDRKRTRPTRPPHNKVSFGKTSRCCATVSYSLADTHHNLLGLPREGSAQRRPKQHFLTFAHQHAPDSSGTLLCNPAIPCAARPTRKASTVENKVPSGVNAASTSALPEYRVYAVSEVRSAMNPPGNFSAHAGQ